MGFSQDQFGRLIAVFGISAEQVQRASFLAVLSLFFSAGTAIGFLFTQSYLLLLLAFGFFVIGATSLISLIVRRRSVIRIYEGGMQFRKFECPWKDIQDIDWVIGDRSRRLEVKTQSGRTLQLPGSITDVETLKQVMSKKVRSHASGRDANGIEQVSKISGLGK